MISNATRLTGHCIFQRETVKYTSVLMTEIFGSLDIRVSSCILQRSVQNLIRHDKISKSVNSNFTFDILHDSSIKRKYHSKIAGFESCHL